MFESCVPKGQRAKYMGEPGSGVEVPPCGGPELASHSKQGALEDLSHAPFPSHLSCYRSASSSCAIPVNYKTKSLAKGLAEVLARQAAPAFLCNAHLSVCTCQLGFRVASCQMSVTPGKAEEEAALNWDGSVPQGMYRRMGSGAGTWTGTGRHVHLLSR